MGHLKANFVIIGGGFYGCAIANYVADVRGAKQIIVIEQEDKILARASFSNQARVHNGYHYPRSLTTAFRSRINLPRFLQEYKSSAFTEFLKLYAIARRNSKVTSYQFQRFCKDIGAKLWKADKETSQLFNSKLIEEVFVAEEYAFDSLKLAELVRNRMENNEIRTFLKSRVTAVRQVEDNLLVSVIGPDNEVFTIESHYVFNCTYSGLRQIEGLKSSANVDLKHEITEMGLIRVPEPLNRMGITVMDGPFFSIMPFPARGLHTVSHVRYTPHQSWLDSNGVNPYYRLDEYAKSSRVDWMMRDVARYIPSINKSRYVDSLFEVKTVLSKSETDDGRPILFEKHENLKGCYSVLGGKIDNIYDVLERLETEVFEMTK